MKYLSVSTKFRSPQRTFFDRFPPMPLLTTAGATALLLLLPTARAFRCYAYTTVSTSNSADPPYLPPKECDGCKAHRLANVGNLSGLTWHGYMHDSPQDCRDALNNAEPAADYDAEGDEAGGGGAGELSEDDCYAIVNCSKLTTFEGEEEAESYNGFGYMFNPPDPEPAYRCWWQDDGIFANGACFDEFDPAPANASSQAELEEVSTASFPCNEEELCNARIPEPDAAARSRLAVAAAVAVGAVALSIL